MQLKKLATMAAALALLSPLAHADVFFFSASPNACNTLPGKWEGDGHVTALRGAVSCDYHGTSTITQSSVPGQYDMDIDLVSTSWICPSKTQHLLGTCNNGNITLNTDEAKLSGTVAENGKVDVKGTVTFIATVPVIGKKTVTATVTNLSLHKQQ